MMRATTTADTRFTHLRDVTTGQIIVCGQCPLGDLRAAHWTTVNDRPVCLCELAAVPEPKSGTTADQPSGQLLGSTAAG